jgi:hypothetical protein
MTHRVIKPKLLITLEKLLRRIGVKRLILNLRSNFEKKRNVMQAISGRKCPYCKSTQNFRQHRQPWMRRIPGSKHYECQYCSGKYVSIYHFFSFGVVKGKKLNKSALIKKANA